MIFSTLKCELEWNNFFLNSRINGFSMFSRSQVSSRMVAWNENRKSRQRNIMHSLCECVDLHFKRGRRDGTTAVMIRGRRNCVTVQKWNALQYNDNLYLWRTAAPCVTRVTRRTIFFHSFGISFFSFLDACIKLIPIAYQLCDSHFSMASICQHLVSLSSVDVA